MLIFLYAVIVASVITATVITWLLLTGRVSPETKIRLPLPRLARRVRTPQEQAQRERPSPPSRPGSSSASRPPTNTINAV